MGSKSPKTQTTVQQPPAFQVPFLQQLFSASGDAFNTGQLGQVAELTPDQLQSQSQQRAFASGGAQDLSNTVQSSFTNLLQNALNPQANPEFENFLRSAIRPIEESLTERILPGIRSGAVQTGNVGSSRQGVAEGQAIRGFEQASGDITSRIVSDAFNRGVQAILQGAALAPSVGQTGLLPANILSSVGAENQAQQQAELDAPFTGLARFRDLVATPITGGATTGPAAQRPSALSRAAGGAASGAAAGSVIPGLGTGWGAAIGAVLGLVA